MKRYFLLAAFLTNPAFAQIVSPQSTVETNCGAKVQERDVLVLDLESFGDDSQAAAEFISRYVEDLNVVSAEPEVIRTSRRTTGRKREHGLERAQSVSADRGCNVALVLSAWIAPSGVAVAQDFGSISVASELLYAFAEVLFATGKKLEADE